MPARHAAEFSASDLKKAGQVLDAATQGLVRIRRRNETFFLLREAAFEELVTEAADPRPKTLDDLLENYAADDVKARAQWWLDDAVQGKETL